MGLFSFLKKAGTKLFSPKESDREKTTTRGITRTVEDAQKRILLKGVVNSLGYDVQDLSLDLNDERVTVYGQVDSQEAKEKIIIALGNVSGISEVDDRLSVLTTTESPNSNTDTAESTFYTVKSGDSLSKIAKRVYGDAMKYPVIFEANKPMLKDPNMIYPGQTLRIPAQQA